MADLLTSDELDGIGADTVAADPRAALATLVGAVDEGLLADPDDASYALTLAASAAALLHDEEQALALARRSIEVAGEGEVDQAHGDHADLLLRFGHEEQGLAELRALRPLLTRDVLADGYVVDPLVENGYSELAEEWLTAALATARDIAERAEPGTDAAADAWLIADGLVGRRRHVRAGMGREPDEDDLLADEMDDEADLTFWPRVAFDEVVADDPARAEPLGGSWDGHRALIERALQEDDQLLVEVITPQQLAAFLTDGPVPTEAGPVLEWPPGRNDPCWCGSGTKYKKCCLPRGRD